MKTLESFVGCALLVLLGALPGPVGAATDPLTNANSLPPSLEQKTQNVRAVLEAGGFRVARGYWRLWSVEDCRYPVRRIGQCYGNNPTAPYVIAFLPHWPDEYVDQSMQQDLTQAQRGMSANYRLGEREALVVVAQMPPSSRYFGIQTNVFTRVAQPNPEDPIYKAPPAVLEDLLRQILFGTSSNPARMLMVASIGNSTNNVVIEQASKESWGQQRFLVITPDRDMASAMTQALGSVGVDPSHVFTEPVSRELTRLGYGRDADDFITYMRYSMPGDVELGEQWRQQLPLTILRVRDPQTAVAKAAFGVPAYEQKTWTTDEPALFADDLGKLVQAVKQHWNQPSAASKSFSSLALWIDLIGQHCLGFIGGVPVTNRGPMNCLGDSQDADYQISSSYGLDQNEVIAIVGVLSTRTGNATYTSLSVNRFPALVGVINRDDPVLEQSAQKFSDVLTNAHTKFYVYYFARDCTGLYPWCHEIPTTLVGRGETIKFIQRNYVNPGSRRGPDPSRILNPVGIRLDGLNRPID